MLNDGAAGEGPEPERVGTEEGGGGGAGPEPERVGTEDGEAAGREPRATSRRTSAEGEVLPKGVTHSTALGWGLAPRTRVRG